MDAKEIGLKIAEKRESLGISQGALAKSVELSRPYITQIENGTKRPSDEAFMKIMAALNMDFKEFLPEEILGEMAPNEQAIYESTMPFITKLAEYLSPEQFNEMLLLLNKTQEAAVAVQAHLKEEPMPSGPDGWLGLNKEDRRLVQRIVNRLNNRKE